MKAAQELAREGADAIHVTAALRCDTSVQFRQLYRFLSDFTPTHASIVAVKCACEQENRSTHCGLTMLGCRHYGYAGHHTDIAMGCRMAQWIGKVGFELQPLADYVLEKIKQGERIFADETILPALLPDAARRKQLIFRTSACLVIDSSCSRSIIALRSAIPPW
ncbi:transposase [Bradyrhizobium sp. 172]|nr:transposase [Bradyrhizobium sp. 172]